MKHIHYVIHTRSNSILPLFLGCMIKHGHKLKAFKILCFILIEIRKMTKKNPFLFLQYLIDRTRPLVHYKIKRKGKRINYIPTLITLHHSRMLAIKWILFSSLLRNEQKFKYKLLSELLSLHSHKGYSYKKKKEIYKIVLKNRFR